MLDMPIRPTWTYNMTKEQLEQQEKIYFDVKLFSSNKIRANIDESLMFRII